LTRLRGFIPPLIADHVRQLGSLPEEAIALTVHFTARPRVRSGAHVRGERLGEGFWHLTVRFGFMEIPDVPKMLHREKSKCPADLDNAVYFSERDRVTARKRKPRMSGWRRRLFGFLYRNSVHPADRFNLPAQNFVQISRQIEV
jgi:KUP system potassium uptake protein